MDVTESSFPKYLLLFTFVLPSVGCASLKSSTSGGTPPPKALNVSIQLNQTQVIVLTGAQQQFSAVVQGTSDTAVNWSVDNVAGGSAGTGKINATGLYTAPNQAGTHTVTATSAADSSKKANATVAVVTALSVSPTSAELMTGTTQQFTATVPGQTNPAIAWSVDGIDGGDPTVGTISSDGIYTAPSSSGSHTVTAKYSGTPSGTASSTVSVFSLSVSPGGALVLPGSTQQFSADVQGISNTSVTWSVDGISGGNSSVGTIDATGLYTAPNALGTHTITATTVASSSGTVQSALTVLNQAHGAVLTYHNDDSRDGAFTEETTLIPSAVNSSQFGKLRSYAVDGQIYAQPLYVPQLSINGTNRDVVFVATENDSVYAFDADQQSSPIWQASLGVPSPRNDVEGISPMLASSASAVLRRNSGNFASSLSKTRASQMRATHG
jgi:hypothetical protein